MADMTKLREQLMQIEEPVFAVLDGAQFDDLPSDLFDGNFVHKPLYHKDRLGNQDVVRTAPQLAWLDNPSLGDGKVALEIFDRLLQLIGDRPAAVFWQCSPGGEALYRHLRTINMILFPRDAKSDPGKSYEASPAVRSEDNNEAEGEDKRTHDLVIFRHADANVMAQVLPALNEPQFARLFGPANTIMFVPDEEWGGRFRRAERPDGSFRPATGPLKLDLDNITAIESARTLAFKRGIARYLRNVAPDQTKEMDNSKLNQLVDHSVADATAFGVKNQDAYYRWAYMNLLTNGKLSQNPAVKELMTTDAPEYSPDRRVKLLMKHTLFQLKNEQLQARNG